MGKSMESRAASQAKKAEAEWKINPLNWDETNDPQPVTFKPPRHHSRSAEKKHPETPVTSIKPPERKTTSCSCSCPGCVDGTWHCFGPYCQMPKPKPRYA